MNTAPSKSAVKEAPQFEPGQRVSLEFWGKPREGTVKEVLPTGYVRVEIDRVTLHEWVRSDRLTSIGEAADISEAAILPPIGVPVPRPRQVCVGTPVRLKDKAWSGIACTVVDIIEGATVRYRIEWYEGAVNATRQANFFREDFVIVRTAKAAQP